jgi:pimeloyl-ACP methyl ester carboxylesterase
VTRRSFYLGSGPDPSLAHLHEPADGASGQAVVIVPPFGWDDVASYRARREWAAGLAAAGHPALRLDLPGTGDAGGEPTDPGRVAAWTGTVADAAAWLRHRHPERRVTAIGLGLGGMIAWAAAAQGAAIDDLVLWATPARGRALVRELRALAALKADEWNDGAPPDDAIMLTDGFDVAGYVISDETAYAVSALDLTKLALEEAGARRLLLIGRDSVPADSHLTEAAQAAGMDVAQAAGPGWGTMTSGPQESTLPMDVVGIVDQWLANAPPARAVAVADPPEERTALALDEAAERPWTAARHFGEQFGILATPDDDGPRPLGMLLLNGGAVRHTGPNRMWVEAARRWAPRGVPVLRFDIEGLGDSDGDGRPYVASARLYEPRLAEQVSQAADELTGSGVADRWLVAGLCAGASWAFHAVLADSDSVGAAVLINPFAFDWEDELEAEVDVMRAGRLREAGVWGRVVSGQISGDRIRTAAAHAVKTPVEWRQRRQRRHVRVQRERDQLDRLLARDKRLTFLIGRDEPIYDRFRSEGMLDELDRWPNVTLRRLPTRDHTFRAPWLQAKVHAELDAAIEAELARLPRMGAAPG